MAESITIPKGFAALCAHAATRGLHLYLCGGCVRNTLLGIPVNDWDITGPNDPAQLAQMEAEDVQVADKAYGLGTFIIRHKFEGTWTVYEYTSFRTDNYDRKGGKHYPNAVRFTNNIDEDAARRDFTINALYADAQGQVLDPTKRGLQDLTRRRLMQITPETLQSDALRILRMARFAAQLGLTVQPQTLECATRYASQVHDLSAERVREELNKILMADAAYGSGSVMTGLSLLHRTGVLRVLIPELYEGEGVRQNPVYHRYDVLQHALHACAQSKPDLTLRWAALLHDVGKPRAFAQYGNFYEHPKIGARLAHDILTRLRCEAQMILQVQTLIAHHMYDLDNAARRKSVTHLILKLGVDPFRLLCDLRDADFDGSGMGNTAQSSEKWREVLHAMQEKKAPLSVQDLAIGGKDLMEELRIPAGPLIGTLLRDCLIYAAKKPSQNNKASLLRYAKARWAILQRENAEH